jgi:hypothetical protein
MLNSFVNAVVTAPVFGDIYTTIITNTNDDNNIIIMTKMTTIIK